MAAKTLVMNFEILGRSAILATPGISVEYDEPQLRILLRTELDSRIFRTDIDHADAF